MEHNPYESPTTVAAPRGMSEAAWTRIFRVSVGLCVASWGGFVVLAGLGYELAAAWFASAGFVAMVWLLLMTLASILIKWVKRKF